VNQRHVIGIGLMFCSVLASREAFMTRNAPMQVQALLLAVLSKRYLGCCWPVADIYRLRTLAWSLELERVLRAACGQLGAVTG
jgi:hypothetical protein